MSEARTARVRVPASAANVGAGYDCIGFAVDRWLTASVTASADSGLGAPEVTIRRDGTLTLLTLAPTAPALAVLPPAPQPGDSFVFQLQGQMGVRYFIQSSPDLNTWTTLSTNTFAGTTLNFTSPVPAGATQSFWRAVWQP